MSGSRSFWFFLRRLFLRGREGEVVVEGRAVLKCAIDTLVSSYPPFRRKNVFLCLRMIYAQLHARLCADQMIEVYAQVHVGNLTIGIEVAYFKTTYKAYVPGGPVQHLCHSANRRTHGS